MFFGASGFMVWISHIGPRVSVGSVVAVLVTRCFPRCGC